MYNHKNRSKEINNELVYMIMITCLFVLLFFKVSGCQGVGEID